MLKTIESMKFLLKCSSARQKNDLHEYETTKTGRLLLFHLHLEQRVVVTLTWISDADMVLMSLN